MKIKGREIKGCNTELIIIPRGEGPDIVLKAKAITDMTPFEKLCPDPMPPRLRTKDGVKEDFKSQVYLDALKQHAERRNAWMIITALTATKDLVWDTVDLNNPDTWLNYEQELKDSGFSRVEINRIIQGTFIANCLDESKLEEARARFLASELEQALVSSSQTDEQLISPPGELASASA